MIKLLYDRVLVKKKEAEKTTKGGIMLPESSKERPQEGKVVAIGEGRLLKDGSLAPLKIALNDIVLFAPWAGNELEVDGEEYLVLKEDDIIGIKE